MKWNNNTVFHAGNYSSILDTRYVKKAGDTMTGLLTVKTEASHTGIKLSNTYLTAISGNVIFQNNNSLRFGSDIWDYNTWAGLKYNHSSKYIYLGLADGSIFEAISAQSGGSILTPGISNIFVGNNTTNKVWHAGNDGSGSGLDADTLDGLHLGSMWIKKVYSINTSGLSTSNFYPIMFSPGAEDLWVEIHSQGDIGAAAYNTNRLNFVIHANGWDDSGKSLTILNRQVYQSNEITIGAIGYGNSEGMIAIWVRGGIGNIYIKSNFAPSLKTSNYTYGSQIFTVGTSYHGGTNTNVTVMWEYGSTTYDVALLSSNVARATRRAA